MNFKSYRKNKCQYNEFDEILRFSNENNVQLNIQILEQSVKIIDFVTEDEELEETVWKRIIEFCDENEMEIEFNPPLEEGKKKHKKKKMDLLKKLGFRTNRGKTKDYSKTSYFYRPFWGGYAGNGNDSGSDGGGGDGGAAGGGN